MVVEGRSNQKVALEIIAQRVNEGVSREIDTLDMTKSQIYVNSEINSPKRMANPSARDTETSFPPEIDDLLKRASMPAKSQGTQYFRRMIRFHKMSDTLPRKTAAADRNACPRVPDMVLATHPIIDERG
jgi:hypothetical protein